MENTIVVYVPKYSIKLCTIVRNLQGYKFHIFMKTVLSSTFIPTLTPKGKTKVISLTKCLTNNLQTASTKRQTLC